MEEFVKTYIESGVLELYALGSLSPKERQDVEAMVAKHWEVKQELQEIETSMQAYALEQAIEPSDKVRHRILNSLVTNLGDDRTFTKGTASKVQDDKEAQIVSLRRTAFYKYAFAASLVLLCLSVAALATVYHSLQQANGQLLAMQTQNQHYSKVVKYQNDELDVYHSSTFKLITLKGTEKNPDYRLVMAWSPVKKQVMVSRAHMNLPVNDQQHQYQLWALVKGKPVDLGVFDDQPDSVNNGMIIMKTIAKADAFAVTLEPRGGSQSPTLDEMKVIAKLQ